MPVFGGITPPSEAKENEMLALIAESLMLATGFAPPRPIDSRKR